jgi:hypothetical protein
VVLSWPDKFDPKNSELDSQIMLACFGPTVSIFQQEQSEQWTSWVEFSKRIGPKDIADNWNDALRSLMMSDAKHDLKNSDQLLFSYDQKKLFRLFISKSTTFLDRSHKLDFYIVEVFRNKDAGDPFTTYLAKAIDIALRYRALFLENGSPYGSTAIRLTAKNALKPLIKELLRELRLLLMQSREAGLDERQHIIELYGSNDQAVDKVRTMMTIWSEQKDKLSSSAEAVLAERKLTDQTFDTFVSTLSEFCDKTKEINVTFTTMVVQRLQEVLKAS